MPHDLRLIFLFFKKERKETKVYDHKHQRCYTIVHTRGAEYHIKHQRCFYFDIRDVIILPCVRDIRDVLILPCVRDTIKHQRCKHKQSLCNYLFWSRAPNATCYFVTYKLFLQVGLSQRKGGMRQSVLTILGHAF